MVMHEMGHLYEFLKRYIETGEKKYAPTNTTTSRKTPSTKRNEGLANAYAFLYYKEIYNNNIKEIYKSQLNRAIEIAKNNNFEEIIDYIMFKDRGFYTLNKQVEIYHNE